MMLWLKWCWRNWLTRMHFRILADDRQPQNRVQRGEFLAHRQFQANQAVWHPGLTALEVAALELIYPRLMNFENT